MKHCAKRPALLLHPLLQLTGYVATYWTGLLSQLSIAAILPSCLTLILPFDLALISPFAAKLP